MASMGTFGELLESLCAVGSGWKWGLWGTNVDLVKCLTREKPEGGREGGDVMGLAVAERSVGWGGRLGGRSSCADGRVGTEAQATGRRRETDNLGI